MSAEEAKTASGAAAQAGPGDCVRRFLAEVRRRMLWRRFLRDCFLAVGANEAVRWGTVLLNLLPGVELPIYTIGLHVLAVLTLQSLVTAYGSGLAARADALLGLQDRLGSFFDFVSRGDVEADYRDAQAAETCERLARVDVGSSLPVRGLMRLGPALVALMFAVDYLYPVGRPPSIEGPGIRPVPVSREGKKEAREGTEVASIPAEGLGQPETGPGERQPRPPEDTSETVEKEKEPTGARPASNATERAGPRPPSQGRRNVREESGKRLLKAIGEPSRLFSEMVGKELTPVRQYRDRALTSGPQAEPPAPLPRGKVAFDLVPAESAGRTKPGGKPGGASGRETREIVVDFDAIPAEYRVFVRKYFEQLGLVRRGG